MRKSRIKKIAKLKNLPCYIEAGPLKNDTVYHAVYIISEIIDGELEYITCHPLYGEMPYDAVAIVAVMVGKWAPTSLDELEHRRNIAAVEYYESRKENNE